MAKCIDAYRHWQQPKPHALTGDLLSPGERVTWRVMSVYRRWSVFVLLQVLTIVWLSFPRYFPGGQFGWNLLWSDLAVAVEMLVGIAFLNQSMRDARIIRAELKELQDDSKLIREIHAALHPDGEGKVVVRHIEGDGTVLELNPDALSRRVLVARVRGESLEGRRCRVRGGPLHVGNWRPPMAPAP